jgi:hypothetical protein
MKKHLQPHVQAASMMINIFHASSVYVSLSEFLEIQINSDAKRLNEILSLILDSAVVRLKGSSIGSVKDKVKTVKDQMV